MLVVSAPPPLGRPHAESPPSANVTPDIQHAVEQFLYHQPDHLDGSKHWQNFIDMFAPDGVYWVPAHPDQTSSDGVPSIFFEDRDLMTIRMQRRQHPRAWSMKTEWMTNHVVSGVIIEKHDPASGAVVCRSRFQMMEFRRDAVRHFAGSYRHQLVRMGDGTKAEDYTGIDWKTYPYWNRIDQQEPREVWVVECVPPTYHPYSKKIMYVQTDNWYPQIMNAWDRKGDFWKWMDIGWYATESDDGDRDESGRVVRVMWAGWATFLNFQTLRSTQLHMDGENGELVMINDPALRPRGRLPHATRSRRALTRRF